MTQKTTTYLATAVRYFANPSLRGNAQETPEMEQRTIGVLSGLQARLPLVVLRLDEQNHYDSQAVVVLEHGRQIAYLAADDAHQCVAEYGERLRVGIPVRVTEVSVEKHGVFWVEKPKMKGASSASSAASASSSSSSSAAASSASFSASLSLPAALDWSGWMEPAALALPAAFRQRIESLELIIDFCLGEIEAGEEGGGPAMESQGTGAQRGSAGSASPGSASPSSASSGSASPSSASFSSFEAMLCEYLGCWLEEVSFDVSREAHERVLRYRQLLEASGRPKLMEMAEKMDRALVKGGCIEVTRKRCEMWQQMMEDEGVKEDFDHLMAFSTSVPQVMLADTEMKVRQLPGRLYDFIADDAKFLSHLRYLMPPLCALRNILSYRLLRKLLCKKLGVSDAACRAAGNTDFSGSFSGCSSGAFSVSPSGSSVSPSGSSVSPSGSSVSSSGSSVSPSSSSVSVSENGEEKGAGSSVYLSPVRGKKIDFIRVVNVLYELGLFTDKEGVRCTKKEAFLAFGRAVNLDLSNYNKDLSRALNDTTTRERQLQIFKDMRQKMAEIYQDKN